jgi:hypothetical protein
MNVLNKRPIVMSLPFGKWLPSREELTRIKQKALQRKIWYKVLSKIERIQIDLTIRVVDKVKSTYLAKVLHVVVKKLFAALESPVKRFMMGAGVKLARIISEIGKKLGCKSAGKWASDLGFIQFITIIWMNTHQFYKVNPDGNIANNYKDNFALG